MARRTVRALAGLEGGVGRWVPAEEAREIAAELAAVSTAAELQEWLASPRAKALGTRATAVLDYRSRLMAPDKPLERGLYVASLIVDVALVRRDEAIDGYGLERNLRFSGQGRWGPTALIRCATCGEHIGALSVSPFYCDEHREDQWAEVDALIAPVTKPATKRRRR
jgi:hypothetical protein